MDTEISSIVELRGAGILAASYRGGRRRGAVRLPDGAIAEVPDAAEVRAAGAASPPACLALLADGRPAAGRHVCLGLVASFVALTGVFLLPSGEIAAVYGAEAVPFG